MYSIENKQATSFGNVKMYVADPWYPPVDGKIRNLLVTDGAAIAKSTVKIKLNNKGSKVFILNSGILTENCLSI